MLEISSFWLVLSVVIPGALAYWMGYWAGRNMKESESGSAVIKPAHKTDTKFSRTWPGSKKHGGRNG